MAWFIFIINLLKGAASVTALLNFFRGRHARPESPFIPLPVQDLHAKLASPLRVIPQRIQRTIQTKASTGLTFILGTSGVGKTREAADLITDLSKVSGARCVYFARGFDA